MESLAILGPALSDAIRYHGAQRRKSTSIPYISHPLAVCSLVLEAGGSPVEAAAALLHDTAEDIQIAGMSGVDVLREIEVNHGAAVAAIVRACSDALPMAGQTKPPHAERKRAYLAHLRSADASTLLVSAADKLHNLRSILFDWERIGDAVWEWFSPLSDKRAATLAYYRELYEIYVSPASAPDPRRDRLTAPMLPILNRIESTPPADGNVRA